MKQLALTLGMLMVSSLAQAKDLLVNIGGKDVTVHYRVLDHEISEKDRDTGSQNSAMECSFLYYGLLAKGDIPGASQLAADPVAQAEVWNKYRERLGGDDFKKEMAAYFTSKNRIIAELLLAEEAMLVVKTQDYTAGQLYQKKNGTYVVLSGKPFSDASKALGKVLNLINEGKIKL